MSAAIRKETGRTQSYANKIPNRKSKAAGSFCHPAVLYKAKFFCKPRFPCFFFKIYTSANVVPIFIHYS